LPHARVCIARIRGLGLARGSFSGGLLCHLRRAPLRLRRPAGRSVPAALSPSATGARSCRESD
jgi:hypothetical protein